MAAIFGTSANLVTALSAGAPGPFGSIANTSGTITVNSAAGPAGNNTITFSAGNADAAYAVLPAGILAPNNGVLGFALNFAAAPTTTRPIAEWVGPGGTLQLRLTTTGALQIVDTAGTTFTGSAPLSTGTRHYVEVYVGSFISSLPSATILVRVDGPTYLSITTAVCNTGYPAVPQIGVIQGASGPMAFTADSIYLLDGSGAMSPNVTFLGPQTVIIDQIAAAPGQYSAYMPTGAGTLWQCVNSIPPPGDATYAADATAGDKMAVALSAASGLADVNFVYVQVSARQETSGGGRTLAVGVGNGATFAVGATQGLATTYGILGQVFDTNPNTSAPWAIGDLATIQAGTETMS